VQFPVQNYPVNQASIYDAEMKIMPEKIIYTACLLFDIPNSNLHL
jgi:hypothetical protein